MACRGVHFALTNDQVKGLLAASDDEERREIIEEIEEEGWEEAEAQETDKAWDAIHRCLADGTLNSGSGSYPLNKAILGGRSLHEGDDYIITLVTPDEVKDVASALAGLDQQWLQSHYSTLSATDYAEFVSDADFEYTWGWFAQLKEFYQKTAGANRTVIFTVDQ